MERNKDKVGDGLVMLKSHRNYCWNSIISWWDLGMRRRNELDEAFMKGIKGRR